MKVSHKWFVFIDFFIIILFFCIYYNLTFITISSDIPTHAQGSFELINTEKFFIANFLYYLCVAFFTLFSNNIENYLTASVFVLAIITYVKYKFVATNLLNVSGLSKPKNVFFLSLCLLLCFSFPILYLVNNCYYIFYFTPNVWHNSTTIFCMPFVFLLFTYTVKCLETKVQPSNWYLLFLFILILIIKPSYLFVYIIVFPLFIIINNNFNIKKSITKLFPVIIIIGLIVLQYFLIYQFSPNKKSNDKVVIDLFSMFKNNSIFNNGIINGYLACVIFMVFSSLVSFTFPLFAIIKNRFLIHKKSVQFSLVSVVFSLIIFCFIAETGSRATHGNFSWQIYMCSFLLFFSVLKELVVKEPINYFKVFKFEFIIFFLHVLSGIIYIARIFIFNNYQ